MLLAWGPSGLRARCASRDGFATLAPQTANHARMLLTTVGVATPFRELLSIRSVTTRMIGSGLPHAEIALTLEEVEMRAAILDHRGEPVRAHSLKNLIAISASSESLFVLDLLTDGLSLAREAS